MCVSLEKVCRVDNLAANYNTRNYEKIYITIRNVVVVDWFDVRTMEYGSSTNY